MPTDIQVDEELVEKLAHLLDRAAQSETDSTRKSIHKAHAQHFLTEHRLVRLPDIPNGITDAVEWEHDPFGTAYMGFPSPSLPKHHVIHADPEWCDDPKEGELVYIIRCPPETVTSEEES